MLLITDHLVSKCSRDSYFETPKIFKQGKTLLSRSQSKLTIMNLSIKGVHWTELFIHDKYNIKLNSDHYTGRVTIIVSFRKCIRVHTQQLINRYMVVMLHICVLMHMIDNI